MTNTNFYLYGIINNYSQTRICLYFFVYTVLIILKKLIFVQPSNSSMYVKSNLLYLSRHQKNIGQPMKDTGNAKSFVVYLPNYNQ